MHMTVPPFDEDGVEFPLLPEELQRELETVYAEIGDADGRLKVLSRPCCWLDLETKRCRHYKYRPVACSRFEPGCDTCLEDRAEFGIGVPE